MCRCLPSCSLRPGARQVKTGIKIPFKKKEKKKKRAERGGCTRCSSLPRATEGNVEGHLNVTSIYVCMYISTTAPTGAAAGGGRRAALGTAGRWDAPTELRRDGGWGGAPTGPAAPAASIPILPPPLLPSRIPAAGFQHRGDSLYTRILVVDIYFFLVRLCVRCRGLIENGVGEKGWGGGGVRKAREAPT